MLVAPWFLSGTPIARIKIGTIAAALNQPRILNQAKYPKTKI